MLASTAILDLRLLPVSQHASPNPSRPCIVSICLASMPIDAPPSSSGSQVYSTLVRLVYHRLQRFLPNTAGLSSKQHAATIRLLVQIH